MEFREQQYVDTIPTNIPYILVGDIGGTNSNFGFFTVTSEKVLLVFSRHAKSHEITDFTAVIKELLDRVKSQYSITIQSACFAAAGVVSPDRDRCKPTNAVFTIDIQDIIAHTNLKCGFIVNDFEVIGYGLDLIKPTDLVQINKGIEWPQGHKAVLGAGTGLGKCMLFWDEERKRYRPQASEGGHADFAPQKQLEFEFTAFIKKSENRECNVSWEDVLSGNGIERMYNFFRHYYSQVPADQDLVSNGLQPDEIFNSRKLDKHSANTFDWYSHFYARCAKNFALDSLSLGGIYIAGGIAAKNVALFQQPTFMTEFINCGKQQELLKNIPVYVIADYNVSLWGAAQYMVYEGICPIPQ
jgi:glucokinase